jgi:hypothetical protein
MVPFLPGSEPQHYQMKVMPSRQTNDVVESFEPETSFVGLDAFRIDGTSSVFKSIASAPESSASMLDGQPLELFTCAPRMMNGFPSTSSDAFPPVRTISGIGPALRFAAAKNRMNTKLFMKLPYRHHRNNPPDTTPCSMCAVDMQL